MKKTIKINTKVYSGFTLVELMVVIAIIGILSAIILANFAAAKSKSRDGQRISDLAQIQLALSGYFNQCNSYPKPTSSNHIDNTLLNVVGTGCPSGITLGTFISKIPTPPTGTTQTSYSYAIGYLTTDSTKTPIDYAIESNLENNISVSDQNLTSFPVTSGIMYPSNFVCNSSTDYCVGPK